MATIYFAVYDAVAILLISLYVIGTLYLIAFRIGYSMNGKKTQKKDMEHRNIGKVSVVLPIYNEETRMIKGAMDSLIKQHGIMIDLIVVIKHPRKGQIVMLRSYGSHLHSLKIIMQRGKPSHNEAFIIGLREARTPYSAILCADAKILDNALPRMVDALRRTGKDVAFGLLYPEIRWNLAGRSTGIAKIARQNLLLMGRYELGLGYFIPGAFAVYRTEFLRNEFRHLLANNFVMHDLGITLRLLVSNPDRAYFMQEVVGTELEKATLKGWLLQNMRWFMGTTALLGVYWSILSRARIKIKIGIIGMMMQWYVLPFALFAGLILAPIGVALGNITFAFWYIASYAVMALIYLSLPDARKYGIGTCIYNWLLESIVRSFAVFAMAFGFAFAKYRTGKLYVLFKR